MAEAKAREHGATLLMVTFISTFLLIPTVGTCIDGAMLYCVRARLSAAVDATALATAQALNVGRSDSVQLSNALTTGQNHFAAHFPSGVMKTTVVGGAPTININEPVAHYRTVTVTASITVPLHFMRILGFKNQLVSASGQASGRDANRPR
jgi:Flp pilus assembly protein TadG